VLPVDDPVLGPKLTVENVDGNHIVLDIGNGAHAFYAHLIKGSLLVKVGDKVRKGQTSAQQMANADDYLTGDFFGPGRLAKPEPHEDQLPMAWSIVNFPG
jgi:hypothetical protein